MSDTLKQAQYAIDNWNLSSGHRVLIQSLRTELATAEARVVELTEENKEMRWLLERVAEDEFWIIGSDLGDDILALLGGE